MTGNCGKRGFTVACVPVLNEKDVTRVSPLVWAWEHRSDHWETEWTACSNEKVTENRSVVDLAQSFPHATARIA